jgi:2-iminobutanoate/2-iminopropanoate deaminase
MPGNIVETKKGPRPAGPYSAAVWAGDMLFLSGQVPLEPSSMKLVQGGITEQAERVFDNIEAVLADAGIGICDVVKTTVYLASADDFAEMNEVYMARFKEPFPARTTAAVSGLPLGALIEVEAVALKP